MTVDCDYDGDGDGDCDTDGDSPLTVLWMLWGRGGTQDALNPSDGGHSWWTGQYVHGGQGAVAHTSIRQNLNGFTCLLTTHLHIPTHHRRRCHVHGAVLRRIAPRSSVHHVMTRAVARHNAFPPFGT